MTNDHLRMVSASEGLADSTGGGRNGLEARIAKVEAAMEHMQADIGDIKQDVREIRKNARSDFLWHLAALSAGFMILLGVMAKGFKWW